MGSERPKTRRLTRSFCAATRARSTAVGISPDNHWVVTGSEDNTARLWDLRAKDPAASPVVLRGHEGEVNAVAISPDNHWLVTGSADNTARLWDLSGQRSGG